MMGTKAVHGMQTGPMQITGMGSRVRDLLGLIAFFVALRGLVFWGRYL